MSATTTTNGASLEDCLTNIFSLIDLNGLRWKRFKLKETQSSNSFIHSANSNATTSNTPIDTHPILTTYAKCLEEKLIASWRHEPQKRHGAGGGVGGGGNNNQHQSQGGAGSGPNHHNHGGGGGSLSSSNFPTPNRTSNNNTPTSAGPSNHPHHSGGNQNNHANQNNNNNNPNSNLELWIFGYGHQLKVDNVIGEDLVEVEDETWESKGLSYECRTLLFKALHNLIERNLISQGYTKIGRWFVQPTCIPPNSSPLTQDNHHPNNHHHHHHQSASSNFNSKLSLSFSFSFFVHGDSTICTSIDVRHHPTIHPLTRRDLNEFQEGGLVRVILAPYGLNGILNGISYKDNDNTVATSTFIRQWSKFFPIPETMSRLFPGNGSSNSRSYLSNLTNMLGSPPAANKSINQMSGLNDSTNDLPPIVEVIVAGQRMRYPTECVFTASKFVDPYKTLCSTTTTTISASITRTRTSNHKFTPNKQIKSSTSLLNDKLTEDRFDSQLGVKVKHEPDEPKAIQQTASIDNNNPFKLGRFSQDGKSFSLTTSNYIIKPTSADNNLINKLSSDVNGLNNNNNVQKSIPPTTNLISRYNNSKVGYPSTNNGVLGPNDLVKIYPTPPSLEQNILSPYVPDETNQAHTHQQQQQLTISKNDDIDVYKPVECFVMQPPTKWAAFPVVLPNMPEPKPLPPECIYKASSQKTSDKTTENHNSKYQELSTLKRRSPTKTIGISLLDNSVMTGNPTSTNSKLSFAAPLSSSSTTTLGTTIAKTTPSTFSIYSLPHQILFNNLVEVSSIQFNLMLSDSVISMILDHNFESCTLCVCNMSVKGSHYDVIPQKSETTNNRYKQSTSNNNSNDLATNEYVNECTCGFSATVTRHCSHLSGLFYEDELELTNMLYEPTEMIDQNKLFRKVRLSIYNESCYTEEKKLIAKLFPESVIQTGTKEDHQSQSFLTTTKDNRSSFSNITDEETKINIIDILKQQCSTSICPNSPLSKILLSEALRNNRHLTSCINYDCQISNKPSSSSSLNSSYLDENNRYTTVKALHRNPMSLKYTDLCEITKSIINKIASPPIAGNIGARSSNPIVKPLGPSSMQGSGIAQIFSSMIGASRSPILEKSSDLASRNNIFIQGLQPLILPTLTIDPKGALQMLEHLLKDESKHALATLNKAILIFASPLHDWQFLTMPMPENNFDVANLLKSIQPLLFDAVGTPNKKYKDYVHQQQQQVFSSRDSPTGAPIVPTPPCQGPLTWRQFHLAAGSDSEDHHEPQPIPSILVGHQVEKSHLALSPFALKFWDKLLLEPYAPGHNIYYLVIGPNTKDVPYSSHYRTFFKELSNMYELMKLGKHTAVGTGILLADCIDNGATTGTSNDNNQSSSNNNVDDSMFYKLNSSEKSIAKNIVSQIKSYSLKMDSKLAKAVVEFLEERQPVYDPHEDRFESATNSSIRQLCGIGSRVVGSQKNNNISQPPVTTYRQLFKQLFGAQLKQVQQQHQQHLQQQQQQQQQQNHQQHQQHHYSQQHMMDQAHQSHHPFETSLLGSSGGLSSSLAGGSLMDHGQHHGLSGSLFPNDPNSSTSLLNSSGSSSLLKSTQSLLSGPSSSSHASEEAAILEEESNKQTGLVIYMIDPFTSGSLNQNLRVPALIGLMKCYTEFLEQLPENIRRITQLQLISLDSLICHSRAISDISRLDQLKSLSMNVFARCRRVLTNQITAKSLTGFGPAAALENFFKTKKLEMCISRVFTPPFILAPTKDKQTELGEMFGDRREKSSVLFCSYCITEDQRWLLASVTNDRGEMSESAVININITERTKRPKASIKRLALRKLMEFIISIMSEWVNPWRLIIGKLGRLGHGELKEWANLLSKTSLLNYSRQLVTKCGQCTILPATETVSILSACLVSLEPDSKLRVMPDQFTNDDRQASFNKCPLSTPEDASATHILVFPTSASIHSTQGIVEDPLVGSGLEDDLLNQFPLDDGIEDLGVEGNMDDLFSAWPDDNQADMTISSHHDTMMSSSNMPSSSGLGGGVSNSQHSLDTAQLLQQPLALGYYISTAKLGPMPNWFWSTNPHLRNSTPVFLKSALHIHIPCVQLSDDLLHSSVGLGKKSHQLDSNLTTDVLRYVLEGYNSLSWLSLHSKTYDRQSCLPVHMQNLLQLYYMMESLS